MEGTESKVEDLKPDDKGAQGAVANENGEGNDIDPQPDDKGAAGDPEPKGAPDKHGHPTVSAGKYERDLKAKDEKIAELQQKLDDAAKTEKGREDLKAEMDKLKQEMADERVNHRLEKAGCLNVKAARALLEDYEDDVKKLKEAAPYLFESDTKGATGFKPSGATSGADADIEKARKAAGLPPKKG